ncbi:MAG TPA: hypothetical protein VFW33_03165, partial [Gemmataceae bacterium]|nr:hypothetical protein [Gemmataceae bacterium]
PPLPGPPGESSRRGRLFDGLLVAIVVALGFLLASFPGGTADLWLHLATGKLLAAGAYTPGAEPFSHTTGGTSWVNPAWLSDGVAYGLFRVGGGTALVVAKALLTALLAAVLLWAGRAGGSYWTSAVCATVGLLAVGARLPMGPVCVSYLGLALTLLLLERGDRRPGWPEASVLAAYWPLLPLFALWANLDAWFLLGPAAVACYALGALLGGRRRVAAGLAVVLAAGLAACCLNPYLVRAFRWPNELGLSEAARALRDAPLFGDLVVSPLGAGWRSSQLSAPSGWAFAALAVIGLFSFAANREGRPWGRALLWGGLLALALYQARAIPFFAVVAAPLMALNFQEAARRTASRTGAGTETTPVLEGLTAVAGLLLLVAAWPGWLQAPPHQRRTWDVEPEPSLRGAAEQVARWRQDGRLGKESLGFNFSPESAAYFAYACPDEKDFLDARLPLFGRQEADDYETVREALLDVGGDKGDGWRDVLRRRGVDHVILYDADPNRLVPALHRLFRDSAEWAPLYADGRTAIFGWLDPRRPPEADRFRAMAIDPTRAAFSPTQAEQAPATWPGRAPRPSGWLDPFVKAPPPRSLDRDEAALCLVEYDAVAAPAWQARFRGAQSARAASILGTTGAAGGPLVVGLDLALRLRITGAEPLFAEGARRPPTPLDGLARALFDDEMGRQGRNEFALLLLAVRAARRALAANPDDAHAYFLLGDAYLRMAHDLPGSYWGARLPMLVQVRRAQASSALNAAVTLRPDLRPAHARLAALYIDMGYLDLALKHRRDAGLEDGGLADEVKRRTDVYQANSSFLTGADRARAALEKGLAKTALDELLASDVSAFGAGGMRMELELLLATGRVSEVRDWMNEDQKQLIDRGSYTWIQARMKAATGDYAVADKDLNSLTAAAEMKPGSSGVAVEMRDALALALASLVASGPLPDGSIALPGLLFQYTQFRVRAAAILGALSGEADLAVLRGLLALEAGRTDDAARHFREALAFWDDGSGRGRLNFPGRAAARTCLDWLGGAVQ